MRVLILLLCLIAIVAAVAPGEVDYTTDKYISSPHLDLPFKVADETSSIFDRTPIDAADLLKDDYLTLTYSHQDARRMAAVSAAAYCTTYGTYSLPNWTCGHCKASGLTASDIQSFYIAGPDTRGFVGVVQAGSGTKTIIVSWRGTKSWDNWLTNLSTAKVAYKGCTGCEVHSGFYNAYLGARSTVVSLITKLRTRHGNLPVHITGHSLGGALAQHNIADFFNGLFSVTQLGDMTLVSGGHPAYDTDSVAISPAQAELLGGSTITATFEMLFPMYTFGQPRVGNSKFAEWFESRLGGTRLFRLTHHRDPVPHVPPQAMGFSHPATEVFYNQESTSYLVCSSTNGEDPNCSNQYTFTLSVKDHGVYAGYAFDSSATPCP